VFNSKHLLAAKLAHNLNNTLRGFLIEPPNVPWDELDEESKHRALVGVAFAAENPDLTPKECHAKWVETMANDGWRVGDNVDYVRKEHPSMVPYSQLPEPQKLKDQLFLAIVREICG
jgi:hypothetical protein